MKSTDGGLKMSCYQCPDCGYIYNEELGDAHEGYPPGFKFADLPEDYVCPDCAVRYKEDFVGVDYSKPQ